MYWLGLELALALALALALRWRWRGVGEGAGAGIEATTLPAPPHAESNTSAESPAPARNTFFKNCLPPIGRLSLSKVFKVNSFLQTKLPWRAPKQTHGSSDVLGIDSV